MPDDFDWDTYDWCYECRGLGDDYRIENDDLVSNCDDCVHNTWREEHDDD